MPTRVSKPGRARAPSLRPGLPAWKGCLVLLVLLALKPALELNSGANYHGTELDFLGFCLINTLVPCSGVTNIRRIGRSSIAEASEKKKTTKRKTISR